MFNKDDVGSGKVQSAADGGRTIGEIGGSNKDTFALSVARSGTKALKERLSAGGSPSSFYASAGFSDLCVGGLRWLRGWSGEHILLNVFGDRQINRKRGVYRLSFLIKIY